MNSQWISVDDRLPGDELEHHLRGGGIKVLVTNGEHIYVASYWNWWPEGEWKREGSPRYVRITHWMPLPLLPSQIEEQERQKRKEEWREKQRYKELCARNLAIWGPIQGPDRTAGSWA